jgi:hypothetical protein
LKRIIARALVLVALSIGGVVSLGASAVATPVQAKNVSDCYAHSICAYDRIVPWPAGTNPGGGLYILVQRDVADAPRNTCFADFGSMSTLTIVNNSAYRWYYFRTSACTGSHLEVGPYDEIHTPAGWDQVHAWFRTSTTS